ncbi:MAG: hypothetical protein FJX72_05610 [Armatimonadetes bacterium]|nr:hypothetical protein [Armatimonadota bacterium]
MTPRTWFCLLWPATGLCLSASGAPLHQTGDRRVPLYGVRGLHMAFEANTGRYDRRVRFVTRMRGATVFITNTEAVMVLHGSQRRSEAPKAGRGSLRTLASSSGERAATTHVLRMKLVGANPKAVAKGLERQPGIVNYLIGNDPGQWRTRIPTYAKAKLAGAYPGVDVVYYATERPAASKRSYASLQAAGSDRSLSALGSQPSALEYDFILRPGAIPERIQLAFEGADRVRVANGDLILSTPAGDVRMKRPYAYQTINGKRVQVACDYALDLSRPHGASFRLARYDASLPLVVDPVIEYSTYLGAESYVSTIAVDGSGAAYLGGDTTAPSFPTTSGAYDTTFNGDQDIFITKLNADGSALVYSTFIGGAGTEHVGDIAVDPTGALYVVGYTHSADFPTTAGAYDRTINGSDSDAMVLKLDATGSALIYSTYLGGSKGAIASGVAVDSTGAAYVAGITWSTDFPTTAGAFDRTYNGGFQDVFVTKLNADGSSLVYSTYIGGANDDNCYGIAIDASGAAYVAGETSSSDYPTTAGAYDRTYNGGDRDAFITKLDATGSALVYSTFMGGAGSDGDTDLTLDHTGAVYLVGNTTSADYPTTPGAYCTTFSGGYYDVFVTKLSPDGSAVVFSTFLGGANIDQSYGIVVDDAGSTHIVGQTLSAGYPTTPGALDTTLSGSTDGFISTLSSDGSALLYSSFIGGAGDDACFGIAVDANGALYVVGATGSADFVTTPGAYAPSLIGSSDGFALKLSFRADTTLYALDRSGTITELAILRGFLRRASDQALLDGMAVDFRIDGTLVGSAVTGATGSTGRADLNWIISDGPATRTITADFAGDAAFSPSTDTATLTALTHPTKMFGVNREGQITRYRIFKAWLYKLDNSPVRGKMVSFKLDGTLLGSDPTRPTGYAQIGYTIADGAGAGIRTVLAEWAGDGGYLASSCTNTLTVLRATPYIWVMPRSVPQGGVARLYAYFRRLLDYQKQEGKTVTFRVDGTWIADVVTLSGAEAGIARYQYTTVEPPGVHTIRCEFAGDAWVDAGYGEGNLTIY